MSKTRKIYYYSSLSASFIISSPVFKSAFLSLSSLKSAPMPFSPGEIVPWSAVPGIPFCFCSVSVMNLYTGEWIVSEKDLRIGFFPQFLDPGCVSIVDFLSVEVGKDGIPDFFQGLFCAPFLADELQDLNPIGPHDKIA